MDAEQIAELKDMIKLSRKRELNFAMCLGKTHKELVLLLHRIRSQDVLLRKARKVEGALPAKYTIGTISTKGRRLLVTCAEEPPAGAARVLRRFLIWAEMPMTIILLDQSGSVVEADGDDADEDDADGTPAPAKRKPQAAQPAAGRASPAAEPAASAPGQPHGFEDLEKARSDRIAEEGISKAMGKWREARRLVGPRILAYAKGRTPDAAGIGQSWERAVKLGDKQNNPVEAYRMLERIVARIKSAKSKDAAPDAAATSKTAQLSAFKALARKTRRRIETGGSPQQRAAFIEAVKLAQRGDPEAALVILEGLGQTTSVR